MDESVVPQEEVAAVEQRPEKVLTQSQVNDIVKREKAQAYERARRDFEAQYAQQSPSQQPQMPGNGMGGMPSLDQERFKEEVRNDLINHIKQLAEDEEKRAQEAKVDQAVKMFFEKLKDGKSRYSDFEEVMTGFDPSAFPQLSFMAGEFDNTSDIIYDLANNPLKLAQVNMLAMQSPDLARKELNKLSQSISKNMQAKQENATPREPLNRLQSSTGVGADSGQMSLKDLKRAPWLRV